MGSMRSFIPKDLFKKSQNHEIYTVKSRKLYRFVKLVDWYPIRTKPAQKKWIESQNSSGARGAATLVGLKLNQLILNEI